MVVYCAAVETGCMLEKYKKVFFSVSAITNAVSVASIPLLLLLFRKDMQFYFLVGVLRLLIIFLFGWVPAAAGACAADISTEAERGAGYCFILPRFRLLHCDASVVTAVVLGCFYLCPLDCIASVIVVDCAAVETGCMLEKYIKSFSPYPLLPRLFPLRLFYCCCCC